MPVRLPDEERDLLAARPVAPDRRQAFIAQVTAALHTVPVVGPGNLDRVLPKRSGSTLTRRASPMS